MPVFDIHPACLGSQVAAPVEDLVLNWYLHKLDFMTGSMQLAKVVPSLSIQTAIHISKLKLHGASTNLILRKVQPYIYYELLVQQ